jgi:Lon protease-like protein
MFPLNTVLLPAMPLPLRIFEERYLKLLGDLMSTDEPQFGVVLETSALPPTDNGHRSPIGTIAAVSEIGATGEFLGLESRGAQRFRVIEWLPDDPYPVADVEFLPDFEWDDGLDTARERLETDVRVLLTMASSFGDLTFGPDVEISDEPLEAIWQLAGVLPVGELDRLDVLNSDSAGELIIRTSAIVEAGMATLTEMLDTRDLD